MVLELAPPVAAAPPWPVALPWPVAPPVPTVVPPPHGGLSHLQVPASQRGAVAGQALLQSPQELLLYLMSVHVPPQIFLLVSQQAQLPLTQ